LEENESRFVGDIERLPYSRAVPSSSNDVFSRESIISLTLPRSLVELALLECRLLLIVTPLSPPEPRFDEEDDKFRVFIVLLFI